MPIHYPPMSPSTYGRGARLSLWVAACVALAGGVGAQMPSPSGGVEHTPRVGTAAVVARAPVIDGRLDDAAWAAAVPLAGFMQRELHEGQPVSERTEVRIVKLALH